MRCDRCLGYYESVRKHRDVCDKVRKNWGKTISHVEVLLDHITWFRA